MIHCREGGQHVVGAESNVGTTNGRNLTIIKKKNTLASSSPCWANLNRQTREEAGIFGKNTQQRFLLRPAIQGRHPQRRSQISSLNQSLKNASTFLFQTRPSLTPPRSIHQMRLAVSGKHTNTPINMEAKACQSHISSQVTTRQRRR